VSEGEAKPGAMWGGRFEGAPDELFRRFNDSLAFDWALVEHDIELSVAWSHALVEAGVITADERTKLEDALREVGAEAEALPAPPLDSGAEDVHSWVEQRLIAKVGDLGKKLHTGRSRNDQVATGLRMWLREAVGGRLGELRALRATLIDLAERHADTAFPAYTHLQPAQPIVFGHWCLAYEAMLARDAARLRDAVARADECPLGCAALAGTTLNIDREALAQRLGFARAATNSLDAVSDRDGVAEVLGAYALCTVHLSRLAEDLIIYNSAASGLVTLDDAVTSGSSLMPQKKNPDALELVRGKCGRITAAHQSLLTTLKGLPLAYNKDMQEDKEPLFAADGQLSLCLRMCERTLRGLGINRERARTASAAGHTNATDLADYLVDKGVPFREAHELVGRIVRLAIEQDSPIEELPLDLLRSVAPQIEDDVFACLTTEAVLARRSALGGTSPDRVNEAVAAARRALEAE